jgi:hypothetical protein
LTLPSEDLPHTIYFLAQKKEILEEGMMGRKEIEKRDGQGTETQPHFSGLYSRRIRFSGGLTRGFLAVRSTAMLLGTKWGNPLET